MKISNGFVTNSSSTSYVVSSNNGITKESFFKAFGVNKALRLINPSDVVCHAKWNITVEYDENGYLVSETFETVNSHKDPDTKTVYGSATYSYAN